MHIYGRKTCQHTNCIFDCVSLHSNACPMQIIKRFSSPRRRTSTCILKNAMPIIIANVNYLCSKFKIEMVIKRLDVLLFSKGHVNGRISFVVVCQKRGILTLFQKNATANLAKDFEHKKNQIYQDTASMLDGRVRSKLVRSFSRSKLKVFA